MQITLVEVCETNRASSYAECRQEVEPESTDIAPPENELDNVEPETSKNEE